MFKLPKWNVDYFTTPDAFNSFEPKWDIELQLITVPITHFVAMTMGCDGHIFDEDSVILSNKRKLAVKDDLSERLRVITNNLEAGSILGGHKSDSKWECNLRNATQWAHDLGWELPEPMLKLISNNIPKPETDNPVQPEAQSPVDSTLQSVKWRKAYEYESEGLEALYDLIERHFFDANGKPIYEPAKWPLKKELVSNWLTKRTLTEADTIITSGKRKGKADK